jgi:hypothetical protein
MSSSTQPLAVFCHDRLKSDFTRPVVRLIRALQGVTQDSAFVEIFSGEIVEVWSELADGARELIKDARLQLEPVELLSQFPLDRLDPEDREWMGELIRKLTPKENSLEARFSSALIAIEDITTQCKTIEPMLATFVENSAFGLSSRSLSKERELEKIIDCATELHNRCGKLITLINSLPDSYSRLPIVLAS